MKTYLLVIVLAAYVSADHHLENPPAPPAPAPEALEFPPAVSDANQHYTPAGDNGYYYYYYPVDETETEKTGMFDIMNWSWMTWLVVSLVVVSLVLLAPAIVNLIGINALMTALGLPVGRTFNMNFKYDEVMDFASNVYDAVQRTY